MNVTEVIEKDSIIEQLETEKKELRASLLNLTAICVRHDLHSQSEVWMQVIERASRAIKLANPK